MACWSSENATKAYLQALKMVKKGKEPDVAEFISALAAGNSAQLMVMACSSIAASTTLALVAAAHQTNGRVVCILQGVLDDVYALKNALVSYASCIEFVIGGAQNLLINDYKGADFVLIDCNIDSHKEIFRAAQASAKHAEGGGLVVGYNAFHKGPWSEFKTHFLPIGEGLLVSRMAANHHHKDGSGGGGRKRSRWVVTVDKCTGEQHVYRITSPSQKEIEA